MKKRFGNKTITEGYELEVVECTNCGFHLGIDATYLEQVDGVGILCPSCGITMSIPGFGDEDGDITPKKRENEDGL